MPDSGEIGAFPDERVSVLLASAAYCTVGALVDFADAVPPEMVFPLIMALWGTIVFPGASSASRRRYLVVLGSLIDRLAFEIEGIPRRRSALL